ncbi:hypothetical protein A2996_00625 [Candidatus Campbellbacteria bacterium RIFCSPLOWO2_01_FULL_34_15]|uniref:Uncharacterized protein n=2 Tax=Candidatus Campbelliibacteriota TaxID=1752727 RepID=A0A1F5EN98_9BACT|nr:MAG: hypothetical protein A2996_00625 [Candidatus Campbellbacteria bacterium RIFCSPLOWO2_01_FULL_34_15]OGD69138.1 MAG: hypothetical protein A2811_01070 [Candidatus Campbellbacteria bacterium RIFCSPHIGHO2_01_FULL_34_10]
MQKERIVIDPFFYPADDEEIKQMFDDIGDIIKKMRDRSEEIKKTCPHTETIAGSVGVFGELPDLEIGPICAKCRKILVK